MSLSESSTLQTVSFVLTKDKVRRLRAIRELQASDHRRVSLSDVARDVVDKGLESFSPAPNIRLAASDEMERSVA